MTKAKKGVKGAAKKKVKRKKSGIKSVKRSLKRTQSPQRAQPPEWARGDEPPFEPDPIKRLRNILDDKDRYDDHRGHFTIPNQPIHKMVRGSGPLPGAVIFVMGQFERQARWLRALFRGILIILRLPGGFEFEDGEVPDDLDDRLRTFDRDLLLNVLERCLILLVAKSMTIQWTELRRADKPVVREIMSEVAGDAPYRPLVMSIELQDMLEGLETNGLLNVVADCFDLLVMVPLLQQQTAALTHDDWKRGAGR